MRTFNFLVRYWRSQTRHMPSNGLFSLLVATPCFALPNANDAGLESANAACPAYSIASNIHVLKSNTTEVTGMKIRFVFDDTTVNATLNDSDSARDFIRQLPLTFKLEDYARTEKIAYLPRKLDTESAPAGSSAQAGDIAYYAPWGNLVIFYKDFGYASGLIPLGQLDSQLSRFTHGSMTVTIELVD